MTHPSTTPINLDPAVEPIPSSARRINVFWFLSLALSLSTVVAGICVSNRHENTSRMRTYRIA
ncbi:hypothetical protein AN958_11517 [Leucoagaricus sp. SymC.cos]|nr:hypothetical protein AN958_11517 [Leucoagaricus sp. SymC.cos]